MEKVVRLLSVATIGKRRSQAPREMSVAQPSGRHLHTPPEVTTSARQSRFPCVAVYSRPCRAVDHPVAGEFHATFRKPSAKFHYTLHAAGDTRFGAVER